MSPLDLRIALTPAGKLAVSSNIPSGKCHVLVDFLYVDRVDILCVSKF